MKNTCAYKTETFIIIYLQNWKHYYKSNSFSFCFARVYQPTFEYGVVNKDDDDNDVFKDGAAFPCVPVCMLSIPSDSKVKVNDGYYQVSKLI
jgi:hypothetical protein